MNQHVLDLFLARYCKKDPSIFNAKDDTTEIGSTVPLQNDESEYLGYAISSLPPVVLVLHELNGLNTDDRTCHSLDC